MLVGSRCFPLIVAYRCQFSTLPVRFSHIRISNSSFKFDNEYNFRGHNSFSDKDESEYKQIELKRRQDLLRTALDNLAQDLLDLSQYLSEAKAERQQLLNHRTDKSQIIYRLKDDNDDNGPKTTLRAQVDAITKSIKRLDRGIRRARQWQIPYSSFYIRLKRVHKSLPTPPGQAFISSPSRIRRSNAILNALLSLPNPELLDDLAQHLLTTSLPITEHSFYLMIHKLSSFRLGSAARSAYHNLITAGYSPTSPRAVSLLLKLTLSIRDRREFFRLQSLVSKSNISLDPYIYSGLITGNLKMGSPTNAFGHFRSMITEGFQPSLQVLTSLLHDCGSRREWSMGAEVWRSIKVAQSNQRFHIDAWAYSSMWRLCRRCEQKHAASEILSSAAKEGFDLQEIIQQRRKKYKSQPFRRTNKSPELIDLQHSMERTLTGGVGEDAQGKMVGHLWGKQLSFRDSKYIQCRPSLRFQSLATRPSVAARRQVDELMLKKTRTLTKSTSNVAEFIQLDIASPLNGISKCHADSSYPLTSMDEDLLDILQEESAYCLSTWFLSATTSLRPSTPSQASVDVSEMPDLAPVPDHTFAQARSLDGRNGLHRISKQRPPRRFIPLSKVRKNSRSAAVT